MIQGIPANGQVFRVDEDDCCRLEGYDTVFALGNAVTGRGNIVESQKHSKSVSLEIMDEHLHWQEDDYQDWLRGTESGIREQVNAIADLVKRKQFMPTEVIEGILQKTEALQRKVGFDGDYPAWVKKNLPTRLEDMLD